MKMLELFLTPMVNGHINMVSVVFYLTMAAIIVFGLVEFAMKEDDDVDHVTGSGDYYD